LSCQGDKLKFVGHLLSTPGYFFFDGCGDAGVRTIDVGWATGVAGDGDT
jgi:hypothetical protein